MAAPPGGLPTFPSSNSSRGLCRFFIQGRCRNGLQCTFSHSNNENHNPTHPFSNSSSSSSSSSTTSGTGAGLCRFWSRGGNCRYGENCKFRHSGGSDHRPPVADPQNHQIQLNQVDQGDDDGDDGVDENDAREEEDDDEDDGDDEEWGRMPDDWNEMLCYGIKPWEDGAWDEWHAIRRALDHRERANPPRGAGAGAGAGSGSGSGGRSSVGFNARVGDAAGSGCVSGCVLLISLELESFFDESYSRLLRLLGESSAFERVTQPSPAIRILSSCPPPTAVMITDAALTKKKHIKVWDAVLDYVRHGGVAVVMGHFTSFVRPPDVGPFFGRAGLLWETESYHRSTVVLNRRAVNENLAAKLPKRYSQKAVHLKNVEPGSRWYSDDEHQVAVAVAKIGNGRLGYVGDVNPEEGSDTVVLGICGLLD